MITITPIDESEVYMQWQREAVRGTIWRTAAGFVADSPSVIVDAARAATDAATAHLLSPTAPAAAAAAYLREVTLAPALDGVTRKYKIEHPDTSPAAYAVAGNDPRRPLDGEPARNGRYANLMPWERELGRVARCNARMSIMLRDGDTVTTAAVAGPHVHITRTENGVEVGRWRVEDGARKVALFLA